MNVMKMMKQAQDLQAKAQKMQAELAAREYTAESGGGLVKVKANGDGTILTLRIDPSVLKPEEAEMVEDLVITALREAVEKGRKEAQAEMGKLTAGLGLPGMF